MKVIGKTIVVTGGGSGIGREITLLLLKRGARVAAIDINETTLNETATLAGDHQDRLSLHVVNITDKAAVEAFADEIVKHYGKVDGVINNAGIIQKFVKINDLDYDNIERNMNVNFWGTVYLTKALLPHLLKRPEAHIINVASMGGIWQIKLEASLSPRSRPGKNACRRCGTPRSGSPTRQVQSAGRFFRYA